MNKTEINNLKNRILNGYGISFEEACNLSSCSDKEALYDAANEIRIFFTGNSFDLCSITNARSGKCPENCKWCAQSSHHNTNIEEYELIDSNVVQREAVKNESYGVNKYSLVTSGKAISTKNLKILCEVYKEVKKKSKITLCASMGLLSKEKLIMLKNSGIEHYHCNLETAPSFFSDLCSTHTYEEKVSTINMAREIGLDVCSGGIIGMGESINQRIELAFELRKLQIMSIPINILNPVKGTPLENIAPLSDDEILTTIALFRFINPKAKLRFAGGRSLIAHIQEKALKAGINAALVGDLLTTVGANVQEDIKCFKDAGFDIGK